MSLIYRDIFNYLITTSPVKELIGARVFGLVIPQFSADDIAKLGGPYPAIRYEESTIEDDNHLGGGSETCFTSLQIDCYAESYPSVKELQDGVRRVLHTFKGQMGATDVKGCLLKTAEDIYEDPVDASDTGVYRVMMDFEIVHSESLPVD